ncbi:Holliday junction ATP-dependent DNA helicase RuvB [subsurface metagenome]
MSGAIDYILAVFFGIDCEIVARGLNALEIDSLGLDRIDRQILRTIIKMYSGGPVGSETLAISIGESVDTLEDVYEPYLIQKGLLQRTPRGRTVTDFAYQHLDETSAPKNGSEDQRLLF